MTCAATNMPLDGITAKALSLELNSSLSDARVDRIYQPDRFDLVFVLRTHGGQKKLILSANPSTPRLHLTSENRSNPAEPPMFCMLLRKHLMGARLLSVSTPGYERIFEFRFSVVNELGDTIEKRLIAEIMGRHSNLILLNQDGRIHDSILHVDQDMSRVREIMPARQYVLPPNQNKLAPDLLLDRIQSGTPWLGEATPILEKAILENCQGFSPQLCQEVCAIAGLDARIRTDRLTADAHARLNRAMKSVLTLIVNNTFSPSVFLLSPEDVIPLDFHAFALSLYAYSRNTTTVSQAMDLYYLEKDRQNTLRQKKQYLTKLVHNQLDHVRKKYQIHQADCAEGIKGKQYKQFGELILNSIQQVDQALHDGHDTVHLINYYDPDLNRVDIPLQINRTASWNAQLYFRRYNKARTKLESGLRLSEQDQQDLAWLESLAGALENASDLEDLIMIRREMSASGLIAPEAGRSTGGSPGKSTDSADLHEHKNRINPGKPGKNAKKSTKDKQTQKKGSKKVKSRANQAQVIAPRRFVSDDGLEILAGRNNIQNDQLTLRTAAKDDIWLHVQKMAGTHVIIRCNQQPVPEQTLRQAAGIAAWFSRAGLAGGAKVAVDYCPVRHVKKPNGARPGMVIYERYQTMIAEPLDPSDLEASGRNESINPYPESSNDR